ncbi:MAG TPA: transketolase, partial [Candidatus Saccharimonadales bacterium]|nr:transketolase [Candidatus Saccharimonadales bacterium]
DILNVAPLKEKFLAFGWHAVDIDGHDLDQVIAALEEARSGRNGKPTCIVAHTVKGKGVSFMENNPEWHGVAPKREQVEAAVAELEAAAKKLAADSR